MPGATMSGHFGQRLPFELPTSSHSENFPEGRVSVAGGWNPRGHHERPLWAAAAIQVAQKQLL